MVNRPLYRVWLIFMFALAFAAAVNFVSCSSNSDNDHNPIQTGTGTGSATGTGTDTGTGTGTGTGTSTSTSTSTGTGGLVPPTIPVPEDGATNQSITVTLGWNAVNGADTYYVRFGDTNPPTYEVITFEDNSISASFYIENGSTLQSNTSYYWQVCSTNYTENSAWSAVWTFSTETVETMTWTGLSPSTVPSARMLFGMAWNGQNVMMFGGCTYQDSAYYVQFTDLTYTWNGNDWVAYSGTEPDRRYGSPLVYDGTGALMFSGRANNGASFYYDTATWRFSGGTWNELSTTGSPTPRRNHSLAYDSVRDRVIMFGGENGSNLFGDIWEFDGTTWTEITASGPEPRYFSNFSFVDSAVLFGGIGNSGVCPNETWLWNGTAWSSASPSSPPSQRYCAAFANNLESSYAIYFGGRNMTTFLAETYKWDGSEWSQILEEGSSLPEARICHGMAYDMNDHKFIMFGGYNGTTNGLDDTWTLEE